MFNFKKLFIFYIFLISHSSLTVIDLHRELKGRNHCSCVTDFTKICTCCLLVNEENECLVISKLSDRLSLKYSRGMNQIQIVDLFPQNPTFTKCFQKNNKLIVCIVPLFVKVKENLVTGCFVTYGNNYRKKDISICFNFIK
ncbi:hypothetical protein SNEBB_009718 [Seison nebaliae]|nr:hypothetical protein SNEBB_009718 [Seison nebaliae]